MYKTSISNILRQSSRPASVRSLHLSSTQWASKPAHEPPSSQGHTVDKANSPLHKDMDVQSAAARGGQDARQKSSSQASGEDQPFDAARQGQADGESKGGHGARGAFADQIGGQNEPHKGPGVKAGGSETAAGYNFTETFKNKLESIVKGDKEKRTFMTSARDYAQGTIPGADPQGAREPKDTSVQGDQNSHLKHTSGGSSGQAKSGNASSDPSLPSKKKQSNQAQSGQTRSFSTSVRAMADPNAPGVGAPRPAEKEAQSQTGLKQQPRGDNNQHGGAAGQPSKMPTDATEKVADPQSQTGAPDPKIPKSHKEGAVKEGMGVRKFSTFSSVRAASPPGGYAKSQKGEPASAGYNAPATALPSGLKSAYQEKDSSAVQGASSDLTPSSKLPFSSSAVDPPNETLKKQVLDGTMPEKNPQPDSEFGRQGLQEGWKHRNIS